MGLDLSFSTKVADRDAMVSRTVVDAASRVSRYTHHTICITRELMETPKYKKSPTTKTVFYLKLTSHHAFQNTVYAKERGLRKRT